MLGVSPTTVIPVHPNHNTYFHEMTKWRICFNGGEVFRDEYLQRILARETEPDFQVRKSMTPVPGFASEGIIEIRDSIFQHFPQIRRLGGPKSYHEAVNGISNGVDLLGQSMNAFMGNEALIELLLMGKVGIFVDKPPLRGPTLADNKGRRPYVYMYNRENIINWSYDQTDEPNEFQSVMLANLEYTYDPKTRFPTGEDLCYRHIYKENGSVFLMKYTSTYKEMGPPTQLNIKRIPFVLMELNDSLMRRVADHQISLLNMGSLDVNFFTKINFPMYVEAKGPNAENSEQTIVVGPSKGRRYNGRIPPSFIAPSSASIDASIKKQEQLKDEIRDLLALGLAQAKTVSGKSSDGNKSNGRGLESGLSHIGLTLQQGEQQIASYWSEYENSKDIPSVFYPLVYQTKTDSERIDEAKGLAQLIDKTPSKTYQKSVAKKLARSLLFGEISSSTLDTIEDEIDRAAIVQSDSETLDRDVAGGLIDPDGASQARGYPAGSAEKAQEAQAKRLAIIAISQAKAGGAGAAANVTNDDDLPNAQARGVPDLSANADDSNDEKVASKDNMRTAQTATAKRGRDTRKRKTPNRQPE